MESPNRNWRDMVDQTCTLEQKETGISGKCDTAQGVVTLEGKADGSKVAWKYETQSSQGPLTVTFDGAVGASTIGPRITGTVLVEEMGMQGSFTANQAK